MNSYRKFVLVFLTAVLVAVLAVIWRYSGSEMPCIFCKIINKEISSELLYEDERFLAFKDIKPDAQHHFLLVPKTHITNTKALKSADDRKMVVDMKQIMLDLLAKSNQTDNNDIRLGFHVSPFHSVKHLHLHGLAPVSSIGWFGSLSFRLNSFWFQTVDELIESLPKA